ncbi:putative membrane protein [Georgenia satyanarayanai]|uniref:Putative membrane protein n=2 Tax=Georgenia satyanarayanai TaxID=860221 RepID=A0A2Y9C2V2_9MICO|nr:putative membrane protein [Georgenia satyanarayanai]SSA36733.1 putative membrane protein [Georgenia satyanarayanai]
MVAAHQSNLAEIAAGTAAQEQASTEAVQEMGATLIADHEALDADLVALAGELGVDLPDQPSPEQERALTELRETEGEAFDTAWIAAQIQAHRTSLAAGQEEIASGSDEDVVALAEAAAPVIQRHLDHLLAMSGEAPEAVPGGLAPDGSANAVGVAAIALGAVVVAASTAVVVRRRQVRA